MPRIRTIKPDFWTDAKIVSVSPLARLLFIGMWNFADDAGNIENSTTQLKMRILPADAADVQELLLELLTHGLVTEYSVNGAKYFNIGGFTKHQVINRPSKNRFPPPLLTEDSRLEVEGNGKEGKEGNGKERKGRDREGKENQHHEATPGRAGGYESPPAPASPASRDNCEGDGKPVFKVDKENFWKEMNKTLPGIPTGAYPPWPRDENQ